MSKDPHLAHHFESRAQQADSAKLGMWLFLVTEILLFGGLFCAYAVYRANHPEIFIYAHQFLDKTLGGINTVVLICSSLTFAWAVRAAQMGNKKLLVRLLAATLLCAFGFLGIKFVEYKHKWEHGLLPGTYFKAPGHGEEHDEPSAGGAEPDTDGGGTVDVDPGGGYAAGASVPRNAQVFFGIYFVMTGLHALHVIAGMAVIVWLILRARKGHFSADYFAPVDLGGLYWHLVDVIWIFLFPLLYLIG